MKKSEKIRWRFVKSIAWVLGLFIFISVMDAQTKKQPTKQDAKAKMKADRLAAEARRDSIAKVLKAKAVLDSARVADSLALIAESKTPFQYRTVKNDAFGVGERLDFTVSYGIITAGEAYMRIPSYEIINGRKTYRIEFAVNSLPSFSWIYKVEDRYLTFVDSQSVAPLRFEQHIREGTYKRDFVAEFDHANGIAKTAEGEYPIPPYIHDIMSSFYYSRTIDFSGMKAGDGITLFNFHKDKAHELRVKVLGRQELEVQAGTFNTIVVEPLVKEGGLFKSEGRIVIWLSDDDRKIPVRVNTKVLIGSIDVELKSYSGLVGPLKARKN